MKRSLFSLFLVPALCLALSAPVLAAETNTVRVTRTELKPGYYLCAVWDGDTLLALFDTEVKENGVLDATVDIGDTPRSGDTVKVGIADVNAEDPTPIVLPNVPVDETGSTGDPSNPSNPNNPNNPNYPGNSGNSGSSSSSSSSSGGQHGVNLPSRFNGGRVNASPRNAKKGDTVTLTVTPNAGCQLERLTVTDSKGNVCQLTEEGDGRFTFTMPASKVTVNAAFTSSAQDTAGFDDVEPGAYYSNAVTWALEQGITTGTSGNTFSPGAACTRGQIVTFLWRAAGSPVSASGPNPFTDVASGSYYYDAVQWAVQQGITTGTSADTFSPQAPCTRGQAVTFLHRANGAPAAGGAASFDDVAADAYCAAAVQWAVERGVTVGTSADTFSPNSPCTRGQIVTFLYRTE